MENNIDPENLSDGELLRGLSTMLFIHALELKNIITIIRQRPVLDPALTMDLIDLIEDYQTRLSDILNKQAELLEFPDA